MDKNINVSWFIFLENFKRFRFPVSAVVSGISCHDTSKWGHPQNRIIWMLPLRHFGIYNFFSRKFAGMLWVISTVSSGSFPCVHLNLQTLKNIVDIQLPFQKQGVLRVSGEKKVNTENSLIFKYFESPRIRWPSALRSRTSILDHAHLKNRGQRGRLRDE